MRIDNDDGVDYPQVTRIMKKASPITIYINHPTSDDIYTSDNDFIKLRGTMFYPTKIIRVTWDNSLGSSGNCNVSDWHWWIDNIPLSDGDNVITITAYDKYGNVGNDIIIVTYTAPAPPITYHLYLPLILGVRKLLYQPSSRVYYGFREVDITKIDDIIQPFGTCYLWGTSTRITSLCSSALGHIVNTFDIIDDYHSIITGTCNYNGVGGYHFEFEIKDNDPAWDWFSIKVWDSLDVLAYSYSNTANVGDAILEIS